MRIETVKIKKDNRRGYSIINKSDFIEGTHQIYSDSVSPAPKSTAKKPPVKKKAVSKPKRIVKKEG